MKAARPEKDALEKVAQLICLKARTAPKTRGIDNLKFKILNQKEKERLVKKMKYIGTKENKQIFVRDAGNIKNAAIVILFGVLVNPAGLSYCGLCQKKNCAQLTKENGVCIFNPLDLGIALGSAVSLAANFGADNRLMYTAGMAALKLSFFKKQVKIIIALPLSGTGKNIFFDRK